MKGLLLSLSMALAAGVVVAACDNPPTPVACTGVPAGGCPQDNGADVCSDPSCEAVYACNSGRWTLSQKCPPHPREAGAADASVDAAESGGPPPMDATFDVPPGAYGGSGCTDLETPDCSVGTALACADTSGCCGCQDLWVCESGSWVLWGECGDAGLVAQK